MKKIIYTPAPNHEYIINKIREDDHEYCTATDGTRISPMLLLQAILAGHARVEESTSEKYITSMYMINVPKLIINLGEFNTLEEAKNAIKNHEKTVDVLDDDVEVGYDVMLFVDDNDDDPQTVYKHTIHDEEKDDNEE